MSHLYYVSTIAKDHYMQAGRDRKQAENQINQLMSHAKMVGMNESHRIFESANKKWRLFLHKTEKTVEDIVALNGENGAETLADEITGDKPEMDGKFVLTKHALERIRERFGFPQMSDREVGAHVNNVLKVATFHSETASDTGFKRNYDALKQSMRIVVDMKSRVIVTVYPLSKSTPIHEDSPLFERFAAVAKRELKKAGAAFRKTQRDLTAQISAIKIELAHAEVNLLNAKGPHIKNIIRKKMDVYARSIDELTAEIGRKESEFERVKADAQAIIGGGEG